jgi:hypothetical protein
MPASASEAQGCLSLRLTPRSTQVTIQNYRNSSMLLRWAEHVSYYVRCVTVLVGDTSQQHFGEAIRDVDGFKLLFHCIS